jgi:dTDP-glucose 4,6-dehydratase
MKLLITGGAGFIGANFISYFLKENPDFEVINIDKLTYAGNLDNVAHLENNPRYSFIKGDICDEALLRSLFKENNIKGVIHFAAESHVDNSIEGPGIFVETNVKGTYTLLEVARSSWMEAPFKFKKGFENARFHHISTDEVYGSLGKQGLFTERTPYAPNSPYSATKAASDFLVRSYHHTYGMNVVTTNCSNNYGPLQNDEKLIPTIIRKAIFKQPIPIYGDGMNIRDWLYVTDHCAGVAMVFKKGISGQTYNIGGNNERTNLKIARTICKLLDAEVPLKKGSYTDLITFVKDRPGHDFRYAIDSSKIESEIGWKPIENFETGILKTVKWYLSKYQNVKTATK